jgi:hypothetical protein
MKSFSGYNENTDRVMKEASVVRKTMSKRSVAFLGNLPEGMERDYAKNFASMINNRCMDIFDDARLLLINRRFSSACVIARGMIETYAFGKGGLGGRRCHACGEGEFGRTSEHNQNYKQ